jgi:hypothetical protein
MAQHLATLDGVPVALQIAGWSLQETANGRDTFQGALVSLDASIRPALDQIVVLYEVVFMRAVSVGNPAVITTDEPHGIITGQVIEVQGTVGGAPVINGAWTVTRLTPTTFSIPVNVSAVGTLGYIQRRIFAGPILQPTEAGVGGWGVPKITTTINASDYSALAARRYVQEVLLAGTLASQLARLVPYLPGCSLHPAQGVGPDLPALPCDDVLVRDVLDTLATSAGGWVWEINSWTQLRMYQPPTDVCPVNLAPGNGVAIGDITVEPTRTGYTNRVILRFTAGAAAAYGFFQLSANPADGETVTLGSTTYTFKTSPGATATDVGIGPDAEASMNQLISAIVGPTDEQGVSHGNSSASAFLFNGGVLPILKAIANTPGAAGNSIACTDTCHDGEWFGEGHILLDTLELGIDAAVTNRVVSEDTAQQAIHGVWETVIQSPETTDFNLAATLAASYLAAHTPIPKTVRYQTFALGVRPGQVQTISMPARHLNGTYLITDVTSAPDPNGQVRRSVTAIESLIVQSADSWRHLYSQWSGGMMTGGIPISAAGGGGAGGGPVVAGLAPFPLGGSDQARVPMGTTPAAAPVLNYNLFVAPAGATSAQLRVWIWAQVNTVQVQAFWSNVTTPTTPVDVAATGWITATTRAAGQVVVSVPLVAGQTYVLRVISNTADAGVYAIGQLEP